MLDRRQFLATGALGALGLALSACGSKPAETQESQSAATARTINVGALKGPTAIGAADMIKKAGEGAYTNTFAFSFSGSPDDAVAQIVSGNLDIAMVPANMAAVLHAKTEGNVKVVNINTQSVLELLSTEDISDFSELADKTIVTTGQGASPEYVLNFLLEKKGIADSVTLDFKSEAAEVVATLGAAGGGTCVLPQPFATAVLGKVDGIKKIANLGDVWDSVVEDGSKLITGVTVARSEYLQEAASSLDEFLSAHKASVEAVLNDPETAANTLVDAGVFENATLIQKAIPNCALTSITGDDMKLQLSGYLSVLAEANPKSVGGSVPADDFYYIA